MWRLIFVEVKAIRVSPLQHITTFDSREQGIRQEFQLTDRIILDVVEHLNLLLNYWSQLLAESGRFIVVCVSLVVEHVPLKFVFRCFFIVSLLLEVRIFLHLVELVAFIISTCGWPMLWPLSEADPTEIVLAQLTSHMVTACTFFNRSLAARTRLRISHNPGDILTLCLPFFNPFLRCFTIARLMWTLLTWKAEGHTTNTGDFICGSVHFPFEAVFTSSFWTPFDHWIIVSKRLAEPFPVSLFIFRTRGEYHLKDTMANFKVTSGLHASCINSLGSTSYFLYQVVAPTVFKKRVTAY